MKPLYELQEQYETILAKFYEAESEEEFAAIADDLAAIESSRDEKLDNCARIIRQLELDAEAAKTEGRRLLGKSNMLENRAERLKHYVGLCLGLGNKARTALFSFSWRKSEQVEIHREDLIPAQYQRVKNIVEPDKAKIKTDIKCGATIPGAALKEKLNLQIK